MAIILNGEKGQVMPPTLVGAMTKCQRGNIKLTEAATLPLASFLGASKADG
jgi:hypothetical protein